MVRVNGHLIRIDGTTVGDFKPDDAEQALHNDEILWLDLHDSSEESLALLRDVFNIHPVAVEDALEFGQRPKIEDYDNFVSIVYFGASSVGQPMVEVHCFFADNFLVTMHREPCVAFEGMRTWGWRGTTPGWPPASSCSTTCWTAWSDSMFPMLASFDDKVDAIQERDPGSRP